MALQVILPKGVEPPRWECLLCGDIFFKDQQRQYERHMATCARRHADEIREMSPRKGPFDPEIWDTEFERWVRQTGRVS